MVRPVVEFERLVAALDSFHDVFLEYLDTLEFKTLSSSSVHWRVDPEATERSRELRRKVEEAAGAGQIAVERADSLRAMPVVRDLEPHNWITALNGEQGRVDALLSVVRQSRGVLEEEHVRAKERDGRFFGLVGLLARFIHFPATVREAAGWEKRSVRGWVATGVVGVIQGLLVTAVGGAIGLMIYDWYGEEAALGTPEQVRVGEQVSVSAPPDVEAPCQLRVLDREGQLILTSKITDGSTSFTPTAPGAYQIELDCEDEVFFDGVTVVPDRS